MFFWLFIIGIFMVSKADEYIVDSQMSFAEAVAGTMAPKNVIDSLVLLDVFYFSFDEKLHKGQILINRNVEKDIKEIFDLILKIKFPIAKAIPVVKFNWSDSISMLENNTSSFNYRTIAGTNRLSLHSFGRAIDINPFLNPVVHNNGTIVPIGSKYQPNQAGTFTVEHPIVKEFLKRGWRWGGHFSSYKDLHHFDKP